jgi:hypothetical protein
MHVRKHASHASPLNSRPWASSAPHPLGGCHRLPAAPAAPLCAPEAAQPPVGCGAEQQRDGCGAGAVPAGAGPAP